MGLFHSERGWGVRLFVESKKSFAGIHPLLSEGLGEAVCLHRKIISKMYLIENKEVTLLCKLNR